MLRERRYQKREACVLLAEMLQARAGVGAELDAFFFLLSCYKVGGGGPIVTNSIDSSAGELGKKTQERDTQRDD
jgi:hypothetical protein